MRELKDLSDLLAGKRIDRLFEDKDKIIIEVESFYFLEISIEDNKIKASSKNKEG